MPNKLEVGLPIPTTQRPYDLTVRGHVVNTSCYPPLYGPGVLIPWGTWKWAGQALYGWDEAKWEEYIADTDNAGVDWLALFRDAPWECREGDLHADGSIDRLFQVGGDRYPLAYYHVRAQALFPGALLARREGETYALAHD